MIDRSTLNAWLLPIAAIAATIAAIIALFFIPNDWLFYMLFGITWLALIVLLVANYIWNLLYGLVLRHKIRPKAPCPYYTAEECTHSDPSECIYDTSVCHIHKTNSKKLLKRIAIGFFLFLSASITILAELVSEKQGFWLFLHQNYDAHTILKILQPISNALIAAIVVYFLIDIPGRLKEYQHFFVDLLSSEKYLKVMGEKKLTQLRKDVTKQLHIKDFPNMPRGLIDIDERFCEMLKHPYFKTYTQTTTVFKDENEDGMIKKNIRVEYVAYNAHGSNRPTIFDIGIANSLYFKDGEDIVDRAKKLFKLKSFKILFDKDVDNDEIEIDLMPYIRIGVADEQKDGFPYNGRVVLMPQDDNYSNKKNPLEKDKSNTNNKTQSIEYEKLKESALAGLYVRFSDKIKVKFEYEVFVPDNDISYTKRLRYPVKYFTLDYSLDNSVENMSLVGQILGTLIDQPHIITEMNVKKTRICLRTTNWLLPKNGAVVVHCRV